MMQLIQAADASRLGGEMTTSRAATPAPKTKRFDEVLGQVVTEADQQRKEAHATLKAFEKGEVQNVHEVMTEMGKADLSFRLMLEIRGRLLESYQTLMRTQL